MTSNGRTRKGGNITLTYVSVPTLEYDSRPQETTDKNVPSTSGNFITYPKKDEPKKRKPKKKCCNKAVTTEMRIAPKPIARATEVTKKKLITPINSNIILLSIPVMFYVPVRMIQTKPQTSMPPKPDNTTLTSEVKAGTNLIDLAEAIQYINNQEIATLGQNNEENNVEANIDNNNQVNSNTGFNELLSSTDVCDTSWLFDSNYSDFDGTDTNLFPDLSM